MKVAVLFFGAPRFYSESIHSIKKHFDFKNISIDFFCHFWDKISYLPINDTRNNLFSYNKSHLHKTFFKNLNIRHIEIESYNNLKEKAKHFAEVFCFKDKFKHTNYYKTFLNTEEPLNWIYQLGQICSTDAVAEFSFKHGEKDYDAYVFCRTDMMYDERSEYLEECYTKCIQDMDPNIPSMVVHGIKKYTNNKDKIREQFVTAYNTPKDTDPLQFNSRIKFNDWFIVCNKLATEAIFKSRLANTTYSICLDVIQGITNCRVYDTTSSPQFTLGRLCALYGVKLLDWSLYHDRDVPVIKIVHSNKEFTKNSDITSSRRIVQSTYTNMKREFNKIY